MHCQASTTCNGTIEVMLRRLHYEAKAVGVYLLPLHSNSGLHPTRHSPPLINCKMIPLRHPSPPPTLVLAVREHLEELQQLVEARGLQQHVRFLPSFTDRSGRQPSTG